jgi:hypothetical protein
VAELGEESGPVEVDAVAVGEDDECEDEDE